MTWMRMIVALAFLSASVLAQFNVAHTFLGDLPGDGLGNAVNGAGDVDGDGFDDVIVGIRFDDTVGLNTGAARVYSGFDGSLIHAFFGDSAGDYFGSSVCGLGDLNGDGHADLAVGAERDAPNGPASGSVRVFSGIDGALLHFLAGNAASSFGASVAAAGDVNGDGVPDIIVGAPDDSSAGFQAGAIRVFSGANFALLHGILADDSLDQLGNSVSGVGDVNGDGFDDFIVGAPGDEPNGSFSGRARVYSGFDASVLFSFDGDASNDHLGRSVSGAGDVNADGIPDFVVGAHQDDDNGSQSGSVRVYSGLDGSIIHYFVGDAAADLLGYSVSGGFDANGDGFADVLAGARDHDQNGVASGAARLYSGQDGSVLTTVYGDSSADMLGTAVSFAGDVNGDGFADFIVGAPSDDDNGNGSGSARVITAPTLPTLKYRTTTGLPQFLDLNWLPDGGDPTSLTGTLSCSGASPGAGGLVLNSLGPADVLFAGYLPILVDVNAGVFIDYLGFSFDASGAVVAPNLTRQHPLLAGYELYTQFFETGPVTASSPAIRFEIVP